MNNLISVADPWYFGTDPDPDPAIFVCDIQDGNKKYFRFQSFLLLLFEGTVYISFQREKVIMKSQNSRNQVFLLFFIDDRRIRISANGSRSVRPKNIQILRIRIRNLEKLKSLKQDSGVNESGSETVREAFKNDEMLNNSRNPPRG